jgi:hypothetical protein
MGYSSINDRAINSSVVPSQQPQKKIYGPDEQLETIKKKLELGYQKSPGFSRFGDN